MVLFYSASKEANKGVAVQGCDPDRVDANMAYEVPDLSGRRVIVTGGTKGIGAATVRLLARSGAEVVIAARDAAAADALSKSINQQHARQAVSFARLDLADLKSVRAFADSLHGQTIDVLINNAGVMELSPRKTVDGFEWHLGINFVAPFLLAVLLAPNLTKGRNPRVVQLSSGAHRMAAFDFDDPNFDRTPFDGNKAYQRSKTACALFAVGFSKHYAASGIEAFSVSPGVVRTELLSGLGEEGLNQMLRALAPRVRTAEQAALAIAYAATSPELKSRGGAYVEDCAVAPPGAGDASGGVMPHAIDPDLAERLWTFAETSIRNAEARRATA